MKIDLRNNFRRYRPRKTDEKALLVGVQDRATEISHRTNTNGKYLPVSVLALNLSLQNWINAHTYGNFRSI